MCTLPTARAQLTCALLALLTGLLNGCLAAKYRPAPKATPPAVALGITGTESDIAVTIDSVIVLHGPGSWKRDAYWDEYVVTLHNGSSAAVSFRDVTLTGVAEHPAGPWTDPWKLEKESRTAMKAGFWLPPGSGPELGAGLTVAGLGVGAGAAWGASVAGPFFSTAVGGAMGAVAAGLVVAPVVGGGTIYRNVSNRHDLEREFDRRRIRLPFELASNQTVQGSLFFPITPGPRTLTMRLGIGAESRDITLDLARIGHLHLNVPDGDKPVRGPSKTISRAD